MNKLSKHPLPLSPIKLHTHVKMALPILMPLFPTRPLHDNSSPLPWEGVAHHVGEWLVGVEAILFGIRDQIHCTNVPVFKCWQGCGNIQTCNIHTRNIHTCNIRLLLVLTWGRAVAVLNLIHLCVRLRVRESVYYISHTCIKVNEVCIYINVSQLKCNQK